MKKYFINPITNTLRAGWRLLIFAALFMVINLTLTFTIRAILGKLKGGGILWFLLLGLSATLAVYISRKYIDKENFISLGLKPDKSAVLDLISGFINSGIVMGCIFFTMLFTGLIEFKGFSWWTENTGPDVHFTTAALPVILTVLFKLMIVAWWEELAWRGMILQNSIKGVGVMWAVIINSVLFGLVHAANPDATVLSTLLIILITPQLIYAYFKSGNLWLPMGIHLGWNFFQSSIFGFAASGQNSPSLIMQEPIGQDWLSGGQFGAEGSLILIPFTIGSLFLIHWWVKKTRYPNQKLFEFTN